MAMKITRLYETFLKTTKSCMVSARFKRILIVLLAISVISMIAMDRVPIYYLEQDIVEAGIRHDDLLRRERTIEATPEIIHPDCNCAVNFSRPSSQIPSDADLTCSRLSGFRGYHQKVVSFSYYEGKYEDKETSDYIHRDYFSGLEKNLKAINVLYGPNWTIRFYYEMPPTSATWPKLCKLVCANSNLDICDVHKIPKLGSASLVNPAMWRYFALLDKQIDVVMIRDLDSLPSKREVAAVNEFMFSEKVFHIMRDNPSHTMAILGGMWGAKLDRPEVRRKFEDTMESLANDKRIFYAHRKHYGPDQRALKKYFWPWVKDVEMSMQHDSYHCQTYTHAKAFPTKREKGVNNFVGSINVKLKDKMKFVKKFECPWDCRPQFHKDWIYC